MTRRVRGPAPVRPARAARPGERGSAVVEFALVAPLVLVLGLGVLQVALAAYVRTTVTAAAAEGARVAALADAGLPDGVRRAREVLAGTIAADLVEDVTAGWGPEREAPTVVVRVTARLPVLGLLAPVRTTVEGHALREPR